MNKSVETKPVNILLVEDNPADVMLTKEALKESKIKITLSVSMDGEDAILFVKKKGKHTEAETPDIILLDLNLPKKDGLAVLTEIKEDPVLKRIPVIILTTSSSKNDILSTYANNANCYIIKPVDFRQFIHIVQTIEEFWLAIAKLPSKVNA